MPQFNVCRSGSACEHYKELGRPAYLIDAAAQAAGLCAPCRARGVGAAGLAPVVPLSFSPVLSVDPLLAAAQVIHESGSAAGEEGEDGDQEQTGPLAEYGEHGEPVPAGGLRHADPTISRLEKKLEKKLMAVEAAAGESAMHLDVNGDGKAETFETKAESRTIKEFGGSTFSPTRQAEETVEAWKTLSDDQVDFNGEIKEKLTARLSNEAVVLFSEALTQVLPSKKGPEPTMVVLRNAGDQTGTIRNSNLFFEAVYQGSNFLMNGHRFKWADDAFPAHLFRFEMMRGSKAGSVIPQLAAGGVAGQDYNCSVLVSRSECVAIFGNTSADEICRDMSYLARMWTDAMPKFFMDESEVCTMVGSEHLPRDVAGSAAHYAAAIGYGLDGMTAFSNHRKSPASKVGQTFVAYLEEFVAEQKFSSEAEAVEFLLSDPRELGDFLYDEAAFSWLLTHRKKLWGDAAVPADAVLSGIRDTQRKVVAFTDLIDRRWGETYQKDGIAALVERFGHPVGLPTNMLRPYHFLPGGYLVEGGWLKVKDGEAFSFKVNFPVDKDGRPNPSPAAWTSLAPVATVRGGAAKGGVSTLAGLGDLAEACASGVEAWHVAYNRGLPRDSLYSAAQLSLIDPSINGAAQDDFSGTVRGLYHPALKGVELAIGNKMRFFPTTGSKISALARRLVDDRTAPRGVLSLKEIDLSNWRLSRLSDNQCGNEYGLNTVKEGEQAPYNFSRLGRDYHEQIQDQVRSFGIDDGLVTFAQPEEDFVRPLVGRQRGETMRFFVERPGSYLRRTGLAGLREGAPKAVYEHIKTPLTPWSAYFDPALGRTTDCTTAANNAPGHQSLSPYAFCATGSGTIRTADAPETESLIFNKFMTTGPGRRGENLPRRLRFAARSLGETATHAGLISPEVIGARDEDGRVVTYDNIHQHVKDQAFVTLDEPKYATELTKAPWHSQILFIKDFELGEMGDTYLKLGASDEERRAVLQMMLAGRQSSRQKLVSPARESMELLQVGYVYPADAQLAYGDMANTGPTLIKYGTTPQVRGQGLLRGVGITMRRMATFGGLLRANTTEKTSLSRSGDLMVTGEPFLFGSRSGWGATGLENTPIRYGDTPPIKAAGYIKKWTKIVMGEGLAMAYNPAEFPGQSDWTRENFKKMKDSLTQQLDDRRKPNADILVADAAFTHQTSQSGDFTSTWNISLNQTAEDEMAMRAAQDTEKNTRNDIYDAGEAARMALGSRSGGYEEYFQNVLAAFRRRGRRNKK